MPKFSKKSAKTSPEITTASLPDIIFMLLIFFMVSTVLRETDVKVRTLLPEAEALTKIEQKRLVSYLYIGPQKESAAGQFGETAIQVDDAIIDNVSSIRTIMNQKIADQPRIIVSMKVDEESQMGVVRDVEQQLREAGTLRINYSSKQQVD